MSEQIKIAITGGTGHLGFSLISCLLERNYSVTALFRNSKPIFDHPNLSWIQGNVIDLIAVESLIFKARAIIHCASACPGQKVTILGIMQISITIPIKEKHFCLDFIRKLISFYK